MRPTTQNPRVARLATAISLIASLPPVLAVAQPSGSPNAPVDNLADGLGPASVMDTPSWAEGMVWYQIFPERFRNADPANDPAQLGWFTKPWNEPWNDVTPAEMEHAWAAGMAAPYLRQGMSPRRSPLDQVVYLRRYGGDLQGIVEALDQLKDLGVTGVYTTPIFASESLHKYDTADFRHMDPTFGPVGRDGLARDESERVRFTPQGETPDPATWTWSPADRYFLDVLLPEARKRGMRVMIDGVWNHTGTAYWAFRDVIQHGDASAYAHWFDFRFGPADPREPILGRPVRGWGGWGQRNGGLPEFARLPDHELPPDVEQHLMDVTTRWMDPNGDGDPSDGVDGWRLDVANELPRGFLDRWRTHVKRINPDALIVGEIWFDAKDYFDGTAFDAQMNYPWAFAVTRWLRGDEPRRSLAADLQRVYTHGREVELVQFNLMGSHDVERASSMMQNMGPRDEHGAIAPRGYDQQGSRRSNWYNDGPPNDEAYARLILGVALQATLPGSPMIYAGDELGMYGADDPDNRKPLPWPDLGPRDDPREDARPGVRRAFAAWLRLRSDSGEVGDLLRRGGVEWTDAGRNDVVRFTRTLPSSHFHLEVIANAGSSAYSTPLGTVEPLSCRAWLHGSGRVLEITPE
ncbi:MAG: alpha-amylase family glycosyl hydrolase [Phycisphaerales bacterium]|jgi:glycosidase|nr:alpha-amylase family glycosyl hydrolase [Phycisphaerales bacterium]